MSSAPQRPIRQIAAQALLILGCIGAITLLQLPQLHQLRTRSQTASLAEIRQDLETDKLNLELLKKLPSFGFSNLIADWVFLNFLQYFGDEPVRNRTDYTLSPDYFEVVLSHDPYFLQAYNFLSTSTSIYAGLPQRTISIMNNSLKSLSPTKPVGSHYVWRSKAIDELLFLGDAHLSQQSFETAADWAEASGLPGSQEVAALSRQTAAFLASKPDSKYAQVSAWTMVLQNAPDERTRNTAIQAIESLGGRFITNPDGSFAIQPPAED